MSTLKSMYTAISDDPFPPEMTITLGGQTLTYAKRAWTIDGEERGLRYGENPDQPAALYELTGGGLTLGGVTFRGPGQGLVAALSEEHMLQAGKHPGKINLTDVDNGLNILQYLAARPAAVILKHNNPSGAAWSQDSLADALHKAFYADRIAAFGGAIVVNRTLDAATAEIVNSAYFEVVAAPDYEADALAMLKTKKNLRILQIPGIARLSELSAAPFLEFKSLIDGGQIVQFSFQNRIREVADFLPGQATDKAGLSITSRAPTTAEAEDLLFAWAVEAGVTSNSVIFARDGATVAIGTGEQDRVGCVQITISKAYTKYADLLAWKKHGLSIYELTQKAASDEEAANHLREIQAETEAAKGGLPGSVLVSDGFFPFRDGVDLAIGVGVTAIAQPGGSIRDTEVLAACNEATPQVAMVFTGQRSFKH
ncbi:AICARFT/IMPCHase bienzyme [Alkalidesulfovibrio alkalitolerans DSM 16529]|uniref:AICARFT/IMPCHase bienzyme n=1 Tax=Alkalidesulfovibrio alkalitolerans DSM 16529 TaxID=1121439 RepID=S7THJ0_9BACT|nr:AICARFT/IMPCHase bienzyme [Alkalidesulfovibrio alkalitolerans]EPR36276.1 AICARFT/IMPCHase bienzyme [Alkalidesulfovibrio alkalitolerans DSM 16529]